MKEHIFYHIYNRANGNEKLFIEDENYRYFLQQWSKYIEPIAETYCYCLLPNHFHFLVRIRNEEEVLDFLRLSKPTLQGFETLGGFSRAISLPFSHLFNGYTQAFNKKYKRKGSLFMSNFKQKEIADDSYFTSIVAYIHRNPIHHHLVTELEHWKHSSYTTLLSSKPTKLQRQYLLDWFGGKEKFLQFHQEEIKEFKKMEAWMEIP